MYKSKLTAAVAIIAAFAFMLCIVPVDDTYAESTADDGSAVNDTDNGSPVASIGDVEYTSLKEAISNVQDGETIVLLSSTEPLVMDANINPKAGIDFTIDLNGRTLDFGDSYRIVGASGQGTMTISNGTLEFGHSSPIQVMGYTLELVNCKVIGTYAGSTSGPIFVWMFGSADSSDYEYSNLIVDADTEFIYNNTEVEVGAYVVAINFLNYGDGNPNNVNAAYGVTVDFAGKMTGNIGCAFYVNGVVQITEGNVPKIHIDMSDEIETSGGIYAAGYAEWDIDGCNFKAPSAISLKSGTFNISGGVFHATGEFADPPAVNNNGSEDTGAAISITSNSGYAQKTVVNITGGTFTSDNGYALYEGIAKKADQTDADTESHATVSIKGGKFTGNTDKGDVKIDKAEEKEVISGGEFSSDVSTYIPSGYDYDSTTGSVVLDKSSGDVEVVAVVGQTEYKSLSDAITSANNGDVIVLRMNTTESVTVPAGLDVTLDLNGFTLSNTDGQHTITNNGTLTVIDGSDAKTGKVDNTSHQKAAVMNEVGATTYLKGGTYLRSQETGSSPSEGGTNTYYNIVNHGTMTISAGVTVSQSGHFSSLVENGWYNGSQNTTGTPSVMTIEGGTFTGGLNTIKNDDYGKITISGGTFTNVTHAAVLNWNEATIKGGTFSVNGEGDEAVVMNGKIDDKMDKGTLTITGGNFTGPVGVKMMGGSGSQGIGVVKISGGNFQVTDKVVDPLSGTATDIEVSGGTFSKAVEPEYLADGFALTETDGRFGVGEGHKVTFSANVEGFQVSVTSEDGNITYTPEDDGSYILADGSYKAVYTLSGYNDATKTFGVSGKDVAVSVEMTEEGSEPEPGPTPGGDDDEPVNPPAGGDDDEDLPPIIRPGGSGSSSSDDDTVTIVACAAAAAVAAILAVFLIYAYRKD